MEVDRITAARLITVFYHPRFGNVALFGCDTEGDTRRTAAHLLHCTEQDAQGCAEAFCQGFTGSRERLPAETPCPN